MVCILSVCGVLALGFSLWKVQARITDPFLVPKSELTNIKKIVGTTPAEDLAKQKRIDTDGDSLSDWDEINLYKTNPNLKDTCGDGLTDNVRVATGKNLQCPQVTGGTQAMRPSPYDNLSKILSPDSLDVSSGTGVSGTDMGTLVNTAAEPDAGAEQLLPRDPKAIREAIKGKVDQAKLDALSDEALLKLYDEALSMQQAGIGQTQATSVTP